MWSDCAAGGFVVCVCVWVCVCVGVCVCVCQHFVVVNRGN